MIPLSLQDAARFLESVKTHDTCIYVASGPRADRCNDFEGDLIGVNNAWRIMTRKPLMIMTQWARYIEIMDSQTVQWLLCPSQVFVKAKGAGPMGRGYQIDPSQCGFPKDQIRMFEISDERFLNTKKVIQKLKNGEMPAMLRFGGIGTYGLIFCALAGYKKIICCGHDGGMGRHPALHDSDVPKTKIHDLNLERTRELALELVKNKYCREIVFAQDLKK